MQRPAPGVTVGLGRLARVVRRGSPHWLSGCDTTPAIVSVDADDTGHARVWRRTVDGVVASEHRFPNWFLTTSVDYLAHLPARYLPAAALRAAHGHLDFADELTIITLDSSGRTTDAHDVYRYLVLAHRMAELETDIVETWNKRDGAEAQTLGDLRGL